MNTLLKKNSEESDKNMLAWLNGEGLVVSNWGTGFPGDFNQNAPEHIDLTDFYTNPKTVAEREDGRIRSKIFPLDMLPLAIPDINTLPLALYLGTEPKFAPNTIWYEHTDISPDNDRDLIFSEDNHWYQNHIALFEESVKASRGEYLIGLPAVVPNLDVLVELRGAQNLLMDLVTDPEWVHEKLAQLNTVFQEVYSRMLPYCTDAKGWSTQGYFMFRGPGKVGLSHCDTASLISVQMFEEFVVPYLTEQCNFLDYSLYHVDGPDAVRSVDPLLEIPSLNALEFTPGPQVPSGGKPCWYDFYKKIKAAGKGVQAVEILPDEVEPLLDEVGPEGMYIMVEFETEEEIDAVAKVVEKFC